MDSPGHRRTLLDPARHEVDFINGRRWEALNPSLEDLLCVARETEGLIGNPQAYDRLPV